MLSRALILPRYILLAHSSALRGILALTVSRSSDIALLESPRLQRRKRSVKRRLRMLKRLYRQPRRPWRLTRLRRAVVVLLLVVAVKY
jgi:hypothetical protein